MLLWHWNSPVTVDPTLIELLACPKCHGTLQTIEPSETQREGFGCASCKLFFAVEDDLPNMLIEDATQWAPPAAAS